MAKKRKKQKRKQLEPALESPKEAKSETVNSTQEDATLASNNPPSAVNPEALSVVGIGASAGGLKALQALLSAMPVDSGLAFVVVVHLYPGKISVLPTLLSANTAMPVHPVTDGDLITPNRVYIIPSDKDLEIRNGSLHLSDVQGKRADNFPIDSFFRSLALDRGPRAAGVILSGTGSDGVQGIKAIKKELGLVVVQTADSALYDGMPSSAIATGLADFVLPPEDMPNPLIEFSRHPKDIAANQSPGIEVDATSLQSIFALLQSRTGHDVSQYKKNTVLRRIERRMSIHRISGMPEYFRYLEQSAHEHENLARDLMIGVTSFFRDPLAFECLQEQVSSRLLQNRPSREPIRAWVPGCSTGEEAYSIAIALHEEMEKAGRYYPVQIFATDIDDDAIHAARGGEFKMAIESDVGMDRVRRYFEQANGRYRIKQIIRESLVFAPQNIIKDPPFTKLDLISCRNLLIYFNSDLQKRLIPLFHYSLKANGILFLGSSESIGSSTDLFSMIDKKWKIFARRGTTTGLRQSARFPFPTDLAPPRAARIVSKSKDHMEELRLVETILEESGTSPCLIIDDECNVLYVHGRTGKFLETPEGKVSVNVLQMAREGLRAQLTTAIRQVISSNQEVTCRGLSVPQSSGECFLDLTVRPIPVRGSSMGKMIVIFDETPAPKKRQVEVARPAKQKKNKNHSIEQLELELTRTKEHLQATIEELEASNEEHRSTSEEFQSTNEELQSTNEELESSKEELQSLNEESATVNAELQARVDELTKSNDDIKNLLDSTSLATIFLDLELKINRYTPAAKKVIPLTPTDIGRPIGDLNTSLANSNLTELGNQVLDDLMMRQLAQKDENGTVYLVQVRPYRTVANVIDGVVITFDDITDRQRAEDALRESEQRFRMLFELANDSIVLIDAESLSFTEFNRRAHENLGYTRAEFSELGVPDIEAAKTREECVQHAQHIVKEKNDAFTTEHRRKTGELVAVKARVQHISIDERDFLLCTWQHIPE